MRIQGCVTLLLFAFLLIGLPFFFGNLFVSALLKLSLSPAQALAIIVLMIFGSAVNIPVKRIANPHPVRHSPWAVFGFRGRVSEIRSETVVAVNLGGCLVPFLLALYEVGSIIRSGVSSIPALIVAVLVNIGVCYAVARPMEGVGIVLPGLVPPLTAVICALWLAPDDAVPVAFVAGVSGPLIGADLLRLRKIEDLATGVVSIGGAGTFDGIVLSGIVAVYLA